MTLVGLIFESAAGLRQELEPRLESSAGLTNQSFDVLIRLARTPGNRLRMSELAAQTTLSPSGLTRSVDRLEDTGLVVRETCPEDRRGAFAVLTVEGKVVMDEAIPYHVAHIDEVLHGVLTLDEEHALEALLRKLRDHLFGAEMPCGIEPGTNDGCPTEE
ncbi:MAG TPA: MarR family winged helix-turn-helix transcriptional regulator [Acidimicrobiales bacterium]|nr:MarR family winged helix-turn-helix transcriptional regulator [Acidimicrobiales bacterium]